MMLDISDGDIWSDVFLNEGDRKEYHSETIIRLSHNDGDTVPEREAEYVADAIRLLEAAGWEIK